MLIFAFFKFCSFSLCCSNRSTTYDRHDYEETDRRFKEIQLKVMKKNDDEVRNQDEPLMSALSANGWIADTPLKRTVEWMFYDFEYAVKSSLISTRHFSGEPGTNAIITDSRGFRGIIDHLAQNFTEKIKTNTVVVQINYTSNSVEVLTQTNHKYRAKYALCTFSTGVLASDLVKFTPMLPQWKKEAISRLPLAFYCNIFVKFPYSFWENQEFIINPASISETFPLLYNLNKKKIHNGSNILLFTAVEDNALRIETQSKEETIAEIMKTLGKMYPNVSLPQPQGIMHEMKNLNQHKITNYYFSLRITHIIFVLEISIGRLSQNPYIRGSFSNSVVGSTTADNHNLQGRLDNLFFAGEATDEVYWGYTQGGYLSGLKQAKAIYNCMTSKNCPKYTPEYRNNYGQRLQCKREFIISLFVSIVFSFFHA